MKITKIIDMDMDGVDYGDPNVMYVDSYLGIKIGDEFSKGKVVEIGIHPESECAWLILSGKGSTYQVDLPYEEGGTDE